MRATGPRPPLVAAPACACSPNPPRGSHKARSAVRRRPGKPRPAQRAAEATPGAGPDSRSSRKQAAWRSGLRHSPVFDVELLTLVRRAACPGGEWSSLGGKRAGTTYMGYIIRLVAATAFRRTRYLR